MSFWANTTSIILAILCGGAIGLERQISGKPAGLRTNILICFGAALFTIISSGMSSDRITAQIVAGIGFLGAGAIIHDRGGVRGLTTAATIWLVAAIGAASGAKYYGTALLSTLIALIVLAGLRRVETAFSDFHDRHPHHSEHKS